MNDKITVMLAKATHYQSVALAYSALAAGVSFEETYVELKDKMDAALAASERYLDEAEALITAAASSLAAEQTAGIPKEILNQSIDILDLFTRSRSCLYAHNIHTVGDLIKLPESVVRKFPNLGIRSLRDIQQSLAAHGLSLGMKL